jgi:predicted DNA-binding protein (MmcQ/YjbR family)
MDIEQYRDYCIAKPGVTEEFPFDINTLVFKVMGKMFALTDVDEFSSINLKCDPERSASLRESNPGITGGYHMSKLHWNTVATDGSVSDPLIIELIDHSYELVVKGLTKKLREELERL